MCNCSKPVTQTECQKLREFATDPEKRFFIYHIFNDKGLQVAFVPSNKNPNEIAIERGFVDEKGLAEYYNVKEHPCLHEK